MFGVWVVGCSVWGSGFRVVRLVLGLWFRPESGLDCLICASLAQQRGTFVRMRLALDPSPTQNTTGYVLQVIYWIVR
jgi:hypothetical protein